MLQLCYRCFLFQVDNLNLTTNLENYCFCAMLFTCKCTPFYKKMDCDTRSESPYHANHPSAIFLKFFDSLHGEDNYLLGFVFPYLESFHLFGYGVSTYV